MNLTLTRDLCGDHCTQGKLSIDGEFECYTLEDVVRGDNEKIPGDTAIPVGRYQIVITRSARFQRDLPLLLRVPRFEGVRIHSGNTAEDTEGCILVGRSRVPGAIQESRVAFDALLPKMKAALEAGEEIWIDIKED